MLKLREGETLFERGDAGDGCYWLRRGVLAVRVASATGEYRILAILGPGLEDAATPPGTRRIVVMWRDAAEAVSASRAGARGAGEELRRSRASAIISATNATNRTLLYALLIMPIWGISSVVAVLSAYSAEIFPTRLRSRGGGLAAGFSKIGGVLIVALVTVAVTPPSIAGTALIGAIPLALATLFAALFGSETRKRQLEEITAEQLGTHEVRIASAQ